MNKWIELTLAENTDLKIGIIKDTINSIHDKEDGTTIVFHYLDDRLKQTCVTESTHSIIEDLNID